MLALMLVPAAARAQSDADGSGGDAGSPSETAAAPALPSVDPAALDDLIRTLEDPQARDAFLGRLRTLLAAQDGGGATGTAAPAEGGGASGGGPSGDGGGGGAASVVAPMLPGLGGALAGNGQGAGGDGTTSGAEAGADSGADSSAEPGVLPPSDRLLMRTLGFLAERLTEAGDALSRMVDAFEDAPQVLAWFERQVTNDVARERWIGIFVALGTALGVGLTLRFGVFLLIRRGVRGLDRRASDGRWLVRVPLVVARVILEVLPLIAFVASASAALTLVNPDRSAQLATLTVINAVLLGGVIRMASRITLAPETPSLRLVPLTDETAAYLHHWLRRLGVIAVYGWFAAEVLFLLGVPSTVRAVLIHVLGVVITALLIVFVLQNRAPVARMIRGDGKDGAVSTARRRLGDIWPILAIAYLVVAFVVWLLDVGEQGFEFVLRATVLSLLIIAVAQGAGAAIGRLIDRGFRVSARMRERLPGLERRANRYLPALRRIAGWIIGIASVLGILQVWGMGGFDWVTSGSGRVIVARLVVIGFVIGLLLGTWEVLNALIRRFLERTDDSGTTIVASNRVRTLLPLLRNVAMIVLGTIGVLVVLSELGLNIAPLLAGAGVVGLAIGFGAQALVSDVITGLFILLEDTIQVGDVVDVGGHAGVVESLSIRAIKLRDLSGNVHTVPFGQVSAVLNMTKEFSYYVFDIGVAYREDTDQVSRIIEEIGAEMQADETYGAQILAPIEILGVDAFADSAVIVKARIRTKPIQQWFVGREFNRRLKKRFDEEGIEIPFPHVTLYFGEDKQGNAPPGRLNVAAPEVIEALAADGDRLKRGKRPADDAAPQRGPERGPERGQALPGDDTSSDLTGGGEPEN